ncbi:DUF1361 domain-containing protein [Levilactobacillus tujiorum]|uniref:DUF1361 domain-containing protein n=1 Tax=Levilactobacillus tujiorum TaxID=2912243 RepID=A0ABX1LBS1_9LACO|nr:DUF1361 domain-containing protein [Levilactobacillus tujiorum]MCH5465509.1 DUF1361 domain-containing protein [Levilactobacillus tujiorum]NLR12594.1 DUF1361 domain-containing protein [Lactobacillus sp. HBUAS51387]NLR30545.1 DUF1361 domain-containing protein [Levilactobacillus tujiorum]
MNRRARWEIRIFFVVWLIFLYFRAKDPFSFLILNTFLGYIPIELSFHLGANKPKSAWLFWPLLIVWLLFYPNAPYLLTDLFHLSLLQPYALSGLLRVTPHLWIYFTYMIISAMSCTLLGFWSLNYVSQTVTARIARGNGLIRVLVVVLLTFLTSVGLYIGRFLRIHTVYLFINPEQFVRPIMNMWTSNMWIFVGLLTFIQLFCYWILYLIMHNHQQSELPD